MVSCDVMNDGMSVHPPDATYQSVSPSLASSAHLAVLPSYVLNSPPSDFWVRDEFSLLVVLVLLLFVPVLLLRCYRTITHQSAKRSLY
jgi:hypothetical protein